MCKDCKPKKKPGRPKGTKCGPYKKKMNKTKIIRRLQSINKPDIDKLQKVMDLIDELFIDENLSDN